MSFVFMQVTSQELSMNFNWICMSRQRLRCNLSLFDGSSHKFFNFVFGVSASAGPCPDSLRLIFSAFNG